MPGSPPATKAPAERDALGDYGWLSRARDIANAVGVVAIALGLPATLSPGKQVTSSWVLMLVSGVGFFAWRHFQSAQHWFAVAISITFVGNIALIGTAPGVAQRVLAVVLVGWWLALAGNVMRVPEVRSDRQPIPAA